MDNDKLIKPRETELESARIQQQKEDNLIFLYVLS